MRRRYCARTARTQAGAYITAVAILLGIAVTLLTFGLVADVERSNLSEQRTARALEQAREALIGYAAAYRDRVPASGARENSWGFLPCPDLGGGTEGVAATACGSKDVTVVGRLPWRTLDLPPLRDGHGECLWYALSGNFKNNPKTDLLNWDTNGLIEIVGPDGATLIAGSDPTNRAAAIVFSPGSQLPGQDRTLAATNPPVICGGNYTVSNYLDADVASTLNNATAASATANALSRYVAAERSDRTAATNDSFNDRLLPLLPSDLFARYINVRADVDALLTATDTELASPPKGMLPFLVDCVIRYGRNNTGSNKRLPWTAPLTLSDYGNANNYSDGTGNYSGRLPMFVPISDAATNNTLVSATTSNRLLHENVCPGWDPTTAGVAGVSEFWDNWKDHIFYAVAKAFAPNSAATSANPCSLDECLTVDGTSNLAAVVIFAGRKQAGQSRNNNANPAYSSANKSDSANYLEGINAANIQSNTPGSAPWPRQFVTAGTNDAVMCIRFDSTVGLFADPTCGNTSVCTLDGASLASYRAGSVNSCKSGKSLLPACKTLEDQVHKLNCPCHKAGHDFNSDECLKGFTTAKCINAFNSLSAC